MRLVGGEELFSALFNLEEKTPYVPHLSAFQQTSQKSYNAGIFLHRCGLDFAKHVPILWHRYGIGWQL